MQGRACLHTDLLTRDVARTTPSSKFEETPVIRRKTGYLHYVQGPPLPNGRRLFRIESIDPNWFDPDCRDYEVGAGYRKELELFVQLFLGTRNITICLGPERQRREQ